MLNQELELSLNMAFARAREHRHEFMTVEHLLLALLSNPSAREALEACSVDLVALRQELEAFIEQTTPVLPASEEERDTQPTLSFQRVLQRAVFHVQNFLRLCARIRKALRRFGQQVRKRRVILDEHRVVADQQDRPVIDVDLIFAEHPLIVDAPAPLKLRTDKIQIVLCRCHGVPLLFF